MWNKHPIEDELKQALTRQFGEEIGAAQMNKYVVARNYLVENVYEEIKGAEPSLTDHGPKHIYNVLSNARDLLGKDISELTGMDLYALCMMILFHDVGNVDGRTAHNKKIVEVYNQVRGKEPKFNQERRVVIKGAEAHCGKTKTGDRDTLLGVEEIESIDGARIRLRELAALLRFADELAEGPQRTSSYMIDTGRYTEESKIFHQYASITYIFIDKGNQRIVLTYHLDIRKEDIDDPAALTQLIHFIFERINKLDEERRYTKYYTPLLTDFKKTEVSINFSFEGMPVDGLDQVKFTLPDQYPVPGKTQTSGEDIMSEVCASLKIEEIIQKIRNHEAV